MIKRHDFYVTVYQSVTATTAMTAPCELLNLLKCVRICVCTTKKSMLTTSGSITTMHYCYAHYAPPQQGVLAVIGAQQLFFTAVA
jgi:hypothetical protein